MRRSLTVIASSIAASASLLTLHPAVADGGTQWSTPAVVASGASDISQSDSDAVGDLAVSVVRRTAGQGTEFDVYTARGDGAWRRQGTIGAVTVGDTVGLPRVATDGTGWAVAWTRRVSDGGWEIVAASAAQVNTSPTIEVLSDDFPDGYVRIPEVAIDGTSNDNLAGGPRYLVGWLGASDFGTHVRVSEMYQQRSWSRSELIQSYASGPELSDIKVAYAADRSAAVGYVNTLNTVKLVTLASRAATGDWTAGTTLVNLGFAATSGPWDLDMPDTATHLSIALANSAGSAVNYAWMRLGFSTPAAQDTIATGSPVVGSLVVSDRLSANAVVAWTEHAAQLTPTVQPYRIKSFVTDLREPGSSSDGQVASGSATGAPRLQIGMNDDGRVWLAAWARSDASRSSITVYAAGPARAGNFWSDTAIAEIANSIVTQGTGLVVPPDESTYPRMIWVQNANRVFSLMASQEVPSGGTVPGAPTGVFALSGDGEATVRWSAPADPGSSAITTYTVTASPGGATCESAARQCTVTGLTNGTAYTFTVAATNLSGAGPASAPSAAITPGPVAPASVKVRAKSNGRMVVRWPASTSPAVTGYVLRVKKGSGSWQRTDVGFDRQHSYTVRVGQRLCAQVASVNAIGEQGPWTPRVCARGRR